MGSVTGGVENTNYQYQPVNSVWATVIVRIFGMKIAEITINRY